MTKFIKKSVKQADVPEDKKGWEIEGIFQTIKEKPFQRLDEKGEIVDNVFRQLILKDTDGNLVAYPCDAGLLQQIELASIQQGDHVKCVNLGKEKLSGARTMNVWDVFVAE